MMHERTHVPSVITFKLASLVLLFAGRQSLMVWSWCGRCLTAYSLLMTCYKWMV
jgi:hypothetical protein